MTSDLLAAALLLDAAPLEVALLGVALGEEVGTL